MSKTKANLLTYGLITTIIVGFFVLGFESAFALAFTIFTIFLVLTLTNIAIQAVFRPLQTIEQLNEYAKQFQPIPKEDLINKLLNLGQKDYPFTVTQSGEKISIQWKSDLGEDYIKPKGALLTPSGNRLTLHILLKEPNFARVIHTSYGPSQKFSGGVGYASGWSFSKITDLDILKRVPLELRLSRPLDSNTDVDIVDPILLILAESGWRIRPVIFSLKLGY